MAAIKDIAKGEQLRTPVGFSNPLNFKLNTPFTSRKTTVDSKAVLFGAGDTTDPVSVVTADKHFFHFVTKSTQTSGDSRGIYWRHYLSAAGTGTGDCARFFMSVAAACAGAFGAHITAQVETGSNGVTGLMNGVRATLAAAAATRTLTGTLAALQVDSDVGAANTLPATSSFIRFADNGSVGLPAFFAIASASMTALGAQTAATAYKTMKVYVEGVGTKFIQLFDSAS